MRRLEVWDEQRRRARGGRRKRLVSCALGVVAVAGLVAISACTGVAPSNNTPVASGSGVTVYGTMDAGISRTRR